jgi:hypothetical protein
MRIVGYILIIVGILDIGSSYILPYGSPLDPIVGPEIAPYTGYVFLGLGYFLKNYGKSDEE